MQMAPNIKSLQPTPLHGAAELKRSLQSVIRSMSLSSVRLTGRCNVVFLFTIAHAPFKV